MNREEKLKNLQKLVAEGVLTINEFKEECGKIGLYFTWNEKIPEQKPVIIDLNDRELS